MALINQLNNLGDAVRERTSTTEKLTLEQMAETIKAIPYPEVEETTITENGVYEPTGDGFSKVTVSIDIPEVAPAVIEEIVITENGIFTAPDGIDGYNPITVEVPPEHIVPILDTLNVIENGTYTPTTGDGFNMVIVDVPSKEPVLQDLVVNINGVFNPPDGTDGFSMVTVNVPTGGGDLPEEALILTGDCSGRFANGGWDWFINTYGNQITTENITSASTMFYNTNDIVEIPFTLNFKPNYNISMSKMFGALINQARIQRTPAITGPCRVSDLDCVFQGAKHLKEITDDFLNGIDWSYYDNLSGNYYGKRTYTFNNCNSLRSYPVEFLRHVNKTCTYSYTIYTNCFYGCYVLEEAVLPLPHTATYTSNCFASTFNNCYRLGRAVFELQDDGTPYVMPWKNQTINLSQQVGYVNGQYASWCITDYSSGITVDKMVSDDASYQALKDDPDWFAVSLDYSRYNHDSAVETINTLPDCSATGTNTIMFKSGSGALTDGGDVANLTEEEIAIATAKGWTVTLV